MTKFIVIISFVLGFAGVVSAQEETTQTPAATVVSAPVTLADAAMPSPVLFDTATQCLAVAAQILKPKDAAKFCLDTCQAEAHRAEVAVKAAAKAAQPSNPCGWGCVGYIPVGGGYYGYSNYGGRQQRTRSGVAYGGNGVAVGGNIRGRSGNSGAGVNTNGSGRNRE